MQAHGVVVARKAAAFSGRAIELQQLSAVGNVAVLGASALAVVLLLPLRLGEGGAQLCSNLHPKLAEHVLPIAVRAPTPEVIAPRVLDELTIAGLKQLPADV